MKHLKNINKFKIMIKNLIFKIKVKQKKIINSVRILNFINLII